MWYTRYLSLVGLLVPLVAQAQVTWTHLDRLDPEDATRRIQFRGVFTGGELIGVTRTKAWRITPPPTLNVTEILCPAAVPTDPPLRPTELGGVNSGGTVVGTVVLSVGGQPRLGGLLQASDGTCTLVPPPAPLVNLRLTAINDVGDSAGETQGPTGGLSRFEGFRRAPDGTLTVLNNVCATDGDGNPTDDSLYPEAMGGPWLTFSAKCNLQPENSYRYEGGFCQEGVGCQTLRDPEGNALWIPAVTPQGTAYALAAPDAGILGGKSWVIDLPTQTFRDPDLPPPITAGGIVESFVPEAASAEWILGTAIERRQPCPPAPASCTVTAQWLGQLPAPAVQPPREKRRPPKSKRTDKDDRQEHDERKAHHAHEKQGGKR